MSSAEICGSYENISGPTPTPSNRVGAFTATVMVRGSESRAPTLATTTAFPAAPASVRTRAIASTSPKTSAVTSRSTTVAGTTPVTPGGGGPKCTIMPLASAPLDGGVIQLTLTHTR